VVVAKVGGDLEPIRAGVSDLQALRDVLGASGASDAELRHYARVCDLLELSPWGEQMCMPGRYSTQAKRKVYKPQITVAGRRTLATRTGELAGIEGPMWCGPRSSPGAPLEWLEVWDEDDAPPYCARTLVHVRGWGSITANGTAKWSEFAQFTEDERGQPRLLKMWRDMPSHMLGKVSESLALRRGFPDVIARAESIAGRLTSERIDLDVDSDALAGGDSIDATG
jgi:hypothetical protein